MEDNLTLNHALQNAIVLLLIVCPVLVENQISESMLFFLFLFFYLCFISFIELDLFLL